MRGARQWWFVAVLAATAAACSSSSDSSNEGEGGAPDYDATFETGTGDDAPPDGTKPLGDSAPGPDAPGADADAAQIDATFDATQPDVYEETSPPDSSPEAAAEAGTDSGHDSGPDAVADAGADADADSDAGADADSDADAGADANTATDAPPDALAEAAVDAGADATAEAGILAPVCDGVVTQGEYGGAANQAASGAQTWLVTWDDTNLYVAIENANVSEANVAYVAIAPGTDAGPSDALAQGQPYDNTQITTLPFGASLVVYAKDGYTEARMPSGGGWNTQDQTSVRICDAQSTGVREEVIPWSLIGGRPSSFGWIGYVAAAPGGNPQGYVYGQMPSDDPGGGPANAMTYSKYFAVPDATPGRDGPFADEQ